MLSAYLSPEKQIHLEELDMSEFDICANCLESAEQFAKQQDSRKAPNKRVGTADFWDIAIKGAHRLDQDSED